MTDRVVALTTAVVCLLCACADGAKLLLVPADHPSHVNFFSVMGRELSEAGHDVTLLSFPRHQRAVEGAGGARALIYPASVPNIMADSERLAHLIMEEGANFGAIFSNVSESMVALWSQMFEDAEFQKTISDAKFDLMLIDGVDFFRCAYILPYRHGVRYVTVNARHDPWSARVSAFPSGEGLQGVFLYDDPYSPTFVERVKNFALYIYMYLKMPPREMKDDLVAEYAPQRPRASMFDLYQGSEMWLVNHEMHCLDFPRVGGPHYIFLGGLGLEPAKPLGSELEAFVGGAKHGVIVMTFGSALKKIPKDKLDQMFAAFAKVEQRVIMRFDGVTPAGTRVPDNVKLSKWLPQNDLLGHPKTRLFITHGGNNGQMEALYHGVPMVTVPVFGDQFYNAKRSEVRGYGKTVDFRSMTSEALLAAMTETINNPVYKKNIASCSAKFRDLPDTAESLRFWVDHVVTFGGGHLKPPYMNMPMWKFFGLDILFVLGECLHVSIHTTKFLVVTIVVFVLTRIKRILGLSKPKQKAE